MAKKILIIFIALVILISAGVIYINIVVLPTKIKALIIEGIEGATQKKVSLESLNFNIFKGLVLEGLSIYDETGTLLSLKECACTFLILPILKKNIVFPSIRLKSPVIFLERRADNSLNLLEPFLKKSAKVKKDNFNLLFYKISVTDARINFQDDTLTPVFTRKIDKINLTLSFTLPTKIKFDFKGEIPADFPIKINSSGEYNISQKELIAKIAIKDLSPKEFANYYSSFGFNIPDGKIDTSMDLRFKDKKLNVNLDLQGKDITFAKEKILAKLSLITKANLRYSLEDRHLEYSGSANISNSAVSGIEFIEKLDDINGEVKFSNSGLSSENLKANCFAMPIEAKINLTNFNNPLVNLNITSSSLNLNTVQNILKEKFKLSLPVHIQGEGKLFLTMESEIPVTSASKISGSLDILNSTVKLERTGSIFEDINGKLKFTPSQLTWSDFNFKYLDINYKTDGILTNFQAPAVEFKLASKDLNLDSALTINGKLVKFSQCTGRYINSKFSLAGDAEVGDSSAINANINGTLDINLSDLGVALNKFKTPLEQIKPAGMVHAEVSLKGNINHIKSCIIQAKLSSDSISLYGLKSGDFLLHYNQEASIADMALMHLSLYDGAIDAVGKMNLSSSNLPYWVSANIQGINLEKLKMDTPAKNNDITGILKADVKINGFSGDLSKLSGAGNIYISEGKLWQLNLFKGLGKLIFAEGAANVVFDQGYCSFIIQDKSIFTDSLKLKGNLAELTGNAKIGFDSSIDALIKIHILDENIPLTNTFRDVLTTIIGESKALGAIKITGTLQEPKYKFQTAVIDVIKGLKDSVVGDIFKLP
jgi:uncharacterized protein involved in outer membrane biogenesis